MSETLPPSEDPLLGPGDVGNDPDTAAGESGADPTDPSADGGQVPPTPSGAGDGEGMDVPPTSNDDMASGEGTDPAEG